MHFLSKGKLEFFKFRKKYTNQKISALTGIPISSIDKIFSGNNKNPTVETISKIAEVLGCSIDDFIENDREISPFYSDREMAKSVQEIYNNPLLKTLYESARELADDDLTAINHIVKKLSVSANQIN